jgi:16S rRNA (adenine1518-N6/adenine1519-N6)-dimethyltransferase
VGRRTRFGQHFLHDPNIAQKIIRLASPQKDETILEIGPGRGILTRPLAESAGRVVAIELDRALYEDLKEDLAGRPNLELIGADALDYPVETLPAPLKVVANLPYYIATPLLFRLLQFRTRITEMVLMLQREVAERIVAPPGGKAYSPLSIGVQFYTRPRLAFIVRRGSFKPPPRVDSAVVRLEVLPAPSVPVRNEEFFFKVVRAGFAHRRKTLKNSLLDLGLPKTTLEEAAATVPVDLGRRAESLDLSEFARLSDALLELQS